MASSWLDVTGGDTSMPALVYAGVSALGKLASSKKHTQIRAECMAIQQAVQDKQKMRNDTIRANPGAPPPPLETDANKYFLVLKLACDTGAPKLMCHALDVTQKLIAFGYLDGSCLADPRIYPVQPNPHLQPPAPGAPTQSQLQQRIASVIAEGMKDAVPAGAGEHSRNLSNGNNSPSDGSGNEMSLSALTGLSASTVLGAAGSDGKLIAVIVDTLYRCAQFKDASVQLLVLKCVLTCITSASCSVHGWTLLQAVSTCYMIFLSNPASANNAQEEINRVTAKATLTQIFNLVFQRMEHFAQQLKQMDAVRRQQAQALANKDASAAPSNAVTPEPSSSPFPSPSPDPSMSYAGASAPPTPANAGRGDEATIGAGNSGSSLRPPTHPQPVAALPPGRRGFCVVCARPANYWSLETKDSVCSLACKLQNLATKDPQGRLTRQLQRKLIVQLELCQNDAYHLLRALCRLAIKVMPAAGSSDKTDAVALAVDSKILSLQLLLLVVSNAGPTFRTAKHFIACIKADVVNCILRNSAASSIETIFALSSSLFVSLVCHFKPHLHAVIGPVLDSIYLPYIASPNSTFEHKYISLTVLHKIASDPQTLLELFINYDCDTGSLGNTFQKIATTLEKVCRSRFVSENWLSSSEEARLRLLALEGLVDTIKSLLVWTKRAQANIVASKQAAEAALAALHEDGDDHPDQHDEADDINNTTGGHSRSYSKTPNARIGGSSSVPPTPGSTTTTLALQSSVSASGGSSLANEKGDGGLNPSFSMQQFHQLRAQKQKLDTGIIKFNMKPRKGLAYLESHGLLHADNASEVADFFLANAASLDKVQVGEFMGEDDAFNKSVLYAYTEKLDFHHLAFDEAIRSFLNGFWLPGEAQKIDRMMEKFAEQYHKHNPGVFSTADTAYVLAYSVVMLNTDAHSPNVKYRMTKEAFFKNCRGIDDGKDVDPAVLSELYDRITTNEIKMKDDSSSTRRSGGGGGARVSGKELLKRDRINAFLQESEQLVKKTQDYLENFSKKHEQERAAQEAGGSAGANAVALASSSAATDPSRRRLSVEGSDENGDSGRLFTLANDLDVDAVRPMFDILCFPSLATFSVLLEEHEGTPDEYNPNSSTAAQNSAKHGFRIIELCLDGYRHAIRLSSALGIETARLAFVTSLKAFTLLGSTREMKLKNIEAIKMLLLISHTEGNHLKDSWIDVLQCISEVERLHLFAGSRPIADVFQSSPMRTRDSDTLNSQHVNKIDASSIDRVFTGSAHLDSEAIVDFVTALRKVSEQELSNISAPRVFSLQKIVEITSYNMSRIRVVWSKIWSVLSAYFCKAGGHPNLNVSMYAIDSLRQLAMKFLEKDELAQFQFQKQFFKPFEIIMLNNQSNETRELIVQCMFRMVASRVTNIKSGWKGVFVVIHTAASQTYAPLVVAGFELLSNIMDHHFELLTSTTDTMDDIVNSLAAFAANNFTQISIKAIQYINQCCDHLGHTQQLRRDRAVARAQASEKGESDANEDGNGKTASWTNTPMRSRGGSALANGNAAGGPHGSADPSIPSSPTDGDDPTPSPGAAAPSNTSANAASTSQNNPRTSVQADLKIWFLSLTALSRMVLDPRPEVRSRALVALFKILAAHGGLFSASTWRAVFHGVLFPVFDDVRHSADGKTRMKQITVGPGPAANGATTSSGNSSEVNTPVAREDGLNGRSWGGAAAATAGGSAVSSHASVWRNPNNWLWPAGGRSPRMSRLSGVVPSAATMTTREPITPGLAGHNGIMASAGSSAAAAVPAAVAQAPRSIPALPPKPPQQPGLPRLPSMAPPVPVPAPNPRPPAVAQASVAAQQRAGPSASPAPSSAENSWLQTTCYSALSTLVDLFDHFYAAVSFMLPDMLQLIHSCVAQENDELARIGIRCLTALLSKVGPKLSVSAWWTALETLAEITQRTMPLELTTSKLRAVLGLPEEGDEGGFEGSSSSRPGSRAGSRRNSGQVPAAVVAAISAAPPSPKLTSSKSLESLHSVPTHELAQNTTMPHSVSSLTVNVAAPSTIASTPSPAMSSATPAGAGPSPTPNAAAGPKGGVPTLSPLPPPSATTAPQLPFASSTVTCKFRVQLQMLEALFSACDAFFPEKKLELSRERGAPAGQAPKKENHSGELDFVGGNGAEADGFRTEGAAPGHASIDDVVLGCLTCEQLFFALDLLSSVLSFARAFNLNLQLRRRLYSAGFQTEQTILGRLPQLFLQETRATRMYVHLLMRLLREGAAGETDAHERDECMNGERWAKLQADGVVTEWNDEASGGATPPQASYAAYMRLSEMRVLGLSLRFLADYVQKSVSGQLVSLEFSEELLCSFLEQLQRLSVACPRRFQNYMSIYYLPLVQLISFSNHHSVRQHLGLLFQTAVPQMLPFTPCVPFPLQKITLPTAPGPSSGAADDKN